MPRSILFTVLLGLLICGLAPRIQAAPLVELVVNGDPQQGKSVAHNSSQCWLANHDGSYLRIDLDDVESFRKLPGEFRPQTPLEMARKVRQELGRSFDVQVRSQLVIAAPSGQAHAYADLLEETCRKFSGYFSRRNVPLKSPEFPLTVIVLSSKQEFDQHCRTSGIPVSPLLQGYYHPHTNRVTLYHRPGSDRESRSSSLVENSSQSTAIHEAIHQLAFNSGLHSRTGENPRWVVEGLATMLETSALQPNLAGASSARVNRIRLERFREFQRERRSRTIADVVASEQAFFSVATLDAYSEAWALTFFLMETRRSDFISYLKKIAARDAFAGEYTPEERLADFQACFGNDLQRLEIRYLRFINSLD